MLGLFLAGECDTAKWGIENALFVDPVKAIKAGLV
jgi:hypothetical protein